MIVTVERAIPFALMHAAILCGVYAGCGGPSDRDEFSCMLITYQQIAAESDRLDQLADRCDRRLARLGLARDLATAYQSLAELARWRAAQLRGGCS